ncbi:MAG TPA: amidohydrolase family protein [Anaerolineaceae bacterium]|nr:amidohydrolase family protein [Anaerolineaceae bacterium]
MELSEYQPRSRLVASQTLITRPRFPVIDAHNHLGDEFGGGWIHRPVAELLDQLDAGGVRVYVDLDGGWGEDVFNAHLDRLKNAAPERFQVFCGVEWSAWKAQGNCFPEWAAERLRSQAARGAQGLKIWKPFGLIVRDDQDRLVAVDDPRLDPVWSTAGELDLPVLIHVADPVAFFDPLDATNERWEELHAHPDWQFPSPPFPPFLETVEALARLVQRHPGTVFIGAHLGCYAENLEWVGAFLDRCPNFFVDIAARIAELGRQPYRARKFFLDYADRILFGSDLGPDLAAYRIMYRFLETADEYFSYSTRPVPDQGRWNIYGLNLPDEVLAQVYYRNAARLLKINEQDLVGHETW